LYFITQPDVEVSNRITKNYNIRVGYISIKQVMKAQRK